MRKQSSWYGLEMLSLYLELIHKQLQETTEQLQNLENCKHKPYVLDEHTVDRIIKAHTEQNKSIWLFLEQCKKWRQQQLSKEQLVEVQGIESNVENLNKTNEQVLALARYFKKRTVNSILKKSDIELVSSLFE